MKSIRNSKVGKLFGEHFGSLPRYVRRNSSETYLPAISLFLLVPVAGAIGLYFAGLAENAVIPGALLAGIGVLGGLLFQVLASTASRIATFADAMNGVAPTPYRISLITRLDVMRANIAYASFLSIVLVGVLGVASVMKSPPTGLSVVSSFLLLHLVLTLLLVLLRINSVGQDDRIAALTAHTRRPSP